MTSGDVTCGVCGAGLGEALLDLPPPAVISTARLLEVPTRLHACVACGHAQSPDLPDLRSFYANDYRISLSSDEHDQVMEVRDGKPVYRTDRQAEVALEQLALPHGARLLDYGAAKAATSRKLHAMRPDIAPHVFDVSDDYRPFWTSWLSDEAVATHTPPAAWRGRFDAVMAHFVLEHVADPVASLRDMAALLRPGGRLFFSVPDWTGNSGDLLVADHINHFTVPSIREATGRAGLAIERIDASALPGAFAVLAAPAEGAKPAPDRTGIDAMVMRIRDEAETWREICRQLDVAAAMMDRRPVAIFGAGFYGALILSRIAARAPVACFLDNNPHLQGTMQFGIRIVPPSDLPPDIETVLVGLNPGRARAIAAAEASLRRPGLRLIFLDPARLMPSGQNTDVRRHDRPPSRSSDAARAERDDRLGGRS
jgi:SAM-dependent methyltransferase